MSGAWWLLRNGSLLLRMKLCWSFPPALLWLHSQLPRTVGGNSVMTLPWCCGESSYRIVKDTTMRIQECKISIWSLGNGARKHLAGGTPRRDSICMCLIKSFAIPFSEWYGMDALRTASSGKRRAWFHRKHIYRFFFFFCFQATSKRVTFYWSLYFCLFIFLLSFKILRTSIYLFIGFSNRGISFNFFFIWLECNCFTGLPRWR